LAFTDWANWLMPARVDEPGLVDAAWLDPGGFEVAACAAVCAPALCAIAEAPAAVVPAGLAPVTLAFAALA
jgi:hypothetical protein